MSRHADRILRGRTVVPGVVDAEALVTHQPISGWGGVDPRTGTIVETRHELRGQSFAGKVLVFPGAKGSSGWSAQFHLARALGTAPAGWLFNRMCTKVALGTVVSHAPAMTDFDIDPLTVIRSGDRVRIDTAAGTVTVTPAHRDAPVPHSAGSAQPLTAAPALACDSHLHIYDRRFPTSGPDHVALEHATAADYKRFQARIGTSRAVIVQPRTNGTDNAVTLDAIQALGGARWARGVGVVRADVSDAQLHALHAGGIRGLRFSIHEPHLGVTRVEMIEPLARRIDALGWHVQLHFTADQIVAHADMIGRLPCTIVIDHMARMPVAQGPSHPAFGIVARLLDQGRTWVKISGPYLDSLQGGPLWADVAPSARALIQAAPERMVWGSDWPHTTERDRKPDDAALFDRLADWAPDEATRRRILVDNPARLYAFED